MKPAQIEAGAQALFESICDPLTGGFVAEPQKIIGAALAALWEQATAIEREACAQLAQDSWHEDRATSRIAAEIRGRSA